MPERIQLSRKRGWRKPENTIVVARPSRWGNPYIVRPLGDGWQIGYQEPGVGVLWNAYTPTREEAQTLAVHHFEAHIGDESWDLSPLAGRNLACWCAPGLACHADVLLELANAEVATSTRQAEGTT